MTGVQTCALPILRGGAGDEGELLCSLPEEHDGLHYDDLVNVSWKDGKPDER